MVVRCASRIVMVGSCVVEHQVCVASMTSGVTMVVEGWDPDEVTVSTLGLDTVWLLSTEVEDLMREARLLLDHLRRQIAQDIAAHGPVVLGEHAYQLATPGRELIAGQEVALVEWLGDDLPLALPKLSARVLQPSKVQAVAESRGLDPEVAMDTFYHRPAAEDTLKLTSIPKKDRRWSANRRHGDRKWRKHE